MLCNSFQWKNLITYEIHLKSNLVVSKVFSIRGGSIIKEGNFPTFFKMRGVCVLSHFITHFDALASAQKSRTNLVSKKLENELMEIYQSNR